MDSIKISNLSKTFTEGKSSTQVLKCITSSLPCFGFIFILGKSGCGKSTLLNIIGGIDKPTSGSVFFPNTLFHRNSFSCNNTPKFIFQHYHLLEEETSLFNVMVPALIQGESTENAKRKSRDALKRFGFSDETINKKARLLSGGEKERVAILRALITDPPIVLADEPTGALDAKNSIKTMEILKEESTRRLVIAVTHNKKLAEKYADRIIVLADGKIKKDILVHETNKEFKKKRIKHKRNDYWSNTIVEHNFRKRFKRNIASMVAMTFSLVFTFLLFGFSNNYERALDLVSENHLDYGSSTISKEEEKQVEKSTISLVKTSKPTQEEMASIVSKFPEFSYEANFDYILGNYLFSFDEIDFNDISFAFVYDFNELYLNNSLIISGRIPSLGTREILINKKAFEVFTTATNATILGSPVHFSSYYENSFENEQRKKIVDKLDLNLNFRVVGVADELEFLSTPKIYLSYKVMEDILENIFMENYSDYKREDFSWKRLVTDAKENDKNSSYSYRVFLKDIRYIKSIEKLSQYLNNEIKLTNSSLEIKEAMKSFVFAADLGMKIFLIIVLTGSILIMCIFSYTAFCDDKKSSAILCCFGAKYSQIQGIFICESLIIGIISFAISIFGAFALQIPINNLIEKLTNIGNLILIPFESFLGVKYLFPIFAFTVVSLVSILSSFIPISFSKRISIKDELADV